MCMSQHQTTLAPAASPDAATSGYLIYLLLQPIPWHQESDVTPTHSHSTFAVHYFSLTRHKDLTHPVLGQAASAGPCAPWQASFAADHCMHWPALAKHTCMARASNRSVRLALGPRASLASDTVANSPLGMPYSHIKHTFLHPCGPPWPSAHLFQGSVHKL